MPNHTGIRRCKTAKHRSHAGSLFATGFRRKGLYFDTTKNRSSFAVVIVQKGRGLVNYLEAVDVTFVRSFAPGKESMSTEHNTAYPRVFVYGFFKFQSQVKSRALPWHPGDLVVEQFTCDRFTIFRCSNSDSSVGVQVIDMLEREERMKRCINRRSL